MSELQQTTMSLVADLAELVAEYAENVDEYLEEDVDPVVVAAGGKRHARAASLLTAEDGKELAFVIGAIQQLVGGIPLDTLPDDQRTFLAHLEARARAALDRLAAITAPDPGEAAADADPANGASA
jgi:hypothetical protein